MRRYKKNSLISLNINYLLLFLQLIFPCLYAQKQMDINKTFYVNSPEWVQTNGPGGGFINDMVIDPDNPNILYAIGSSSGFYKTINSGDSWELKEFPDQIHASNLEISSGNPNILYCDYDNLSKSTDGGQTWQNCSDNFGNTISSNIFKIDPLDPAIIYVAGRLGDGQGIEIYKSENNGDDWVNITGDFNEPSGCEVTALALAGNGKIFVGINDRELLDWHCGKVFYTSNDGVSWQHVDFGQTDDRFIWSILVNPYHLDQVWISEGPLYNDYISMPWLYCSEDTGSTWTPIYPSVQLDATQIRVLGVSADGNNVYVAGGGGLSYTNDIGNTFYKISLPDEIMRFDLYNIAPHPNSPEIIFLPTGSGGVAYSDNNGTDWIQKNEGILATSINLLSPDPIDPGRIYCASWIGEGIFKTEDYGQNWKYLNKGGIVHPWDDELLVDPTSPNNIWFMPDVPYLHKSSDYGNTWDVLNHPDQGNTFNFSSIYALAQSSDDEIMYALNNGFGIFKGNRTWNDESYHWSYLNLSEIDYSYSLAVESGNADIIYSGYSRKPFETKAKIRASYNGGESWFTSLEVEGSKAISSVFIDPISPDNVYAASVNENGGKLWKSEDKGQTWQNLNEYFNFTTIHSFAVPSNNSSIAYAGVWGGGTYKTIDYGNSWEKIEGDESFSAAAIAIDSDDPDIVYIADRTLPILYKSNDGGENWSEYLNAGSEYRRLMSVTVDPHHIDRVYVSAMKMGGPGKLGGLFKIENGNVIDITGILSKVPLNLTIDPLDSSILFVVLHESGIYKSENGGTDWIKISDPNSGLPESGFNNLIIDPYNSNRLYLIGGCDVRFDTFESAGLDPDTVNGVYRSVDGGINWQNINRNVLGEASGAVKSLVFYDSSLVFYLSTENGVYYTIDGGNNWLKSEELPYNTLGGIAISGHTIYAFTNGAGLFKGLIQEDYSIEWDESQKIFPEIYFAQIIKDHTNSNVIFASGYPGGIFKSTDGGVTWHEKNFGMVSFKVDDPLRQGYYALAQSKSDGDVFYLGIYKKGIYKSTNGCETWYPVNGQFFEMAGKKITTIAIDNSNTDICYIGAEEGIYKTINGGHSWSEINQGLASRDVKVLYMNASNQLFAGTRGYGLYQLINNKWQAHEGFGNWGVIWPIWNDRPMYQYTSFLIHPEDNSRMIIGTFPQGIYKSNDGGNSWKESNVGWTNDGVFSLICHPNNSEIVYAGTYNGINRSLDFGEHWEMWDEGMPPEQWVFSIDFDPTNPEIMYACSKNGENEGTGRDGYMGTVMKSWDGGENWIEITNGLEDEYDEIHQEFYKIIVDRFNPDILYLAAQHEGIYISRNAGESWELWNDGLTNPVPGVNGNNVTNTLVLSADHSILYFGTAGTGVWRRMITSVLPVNRLSAKVKNHQVTLNWSFYDLNNSFSHYNIYRANEYFSNIGQASKIASISGVADTFYIDPNILEGIHYYYAVTTNDQSGYENDHTYVLGPVVDHPFHISTTTIDSGFVGEAYRDTLEIIGGDPPYTWEVTSGTLPSGLGLLSTGIIRGIPEEAGNFQFRVKATDSRQPPNSDSLLCNLYIGQVTDINNSDLPKVFALKQNFPNPFNPVTKIMYDLPYAENVKIEVYNFLGQKVVILLNKKMPAGYHEIEFNGQDLSSGIYIYKINAGNFQAVKKAILLK